jgi:O-antigen ligase
MPVKWEVVLRTNFLYPSQRHPVLLTALEQTSVAFYWLLFPFAAVVAIPAVSIPAARSAVARHSWKLLCLVLLPVIYWGLFREFAIGRGSIVAPSLLVIGACMFLFAVFMLTNVRRLKRFPLLFQMACYFLAACLSGVHSISYLHWARGVLELGLAFCFLLYPYFFLSDRRQVELSLKVLVVLAAGTVVFAILQAVLFSPLRGMVSALYRREDLWWIVGWGWRGRLAGNWVHPSYLGSVLNVAAPFALLHYARAPRRLSLALYLVIAAGIVLTGTRTPLLSFFLSSVAFIVLSRRPRALTALAYAGVLAITLSFFHFRFAPPDVGSRGFVLKTMSLVERLELGRSKNRATLDMRWITQSEALTLFRTSPILGIGMRNYPDRARDSDPMAVYSIHNSLIQNLAELGTFGLVAFLILIFGALRSDFRPQLARFPALRPLRAALFCSSAAILLESLAENSLAIWQVLSLFWLIRGIALVIAQHPAAFLNGPVPVLGTEHTDQAHPGSPEHRLDALETAVGWGVASGSTRSPGQIFRSHSCPG